LVQARSTKRGMTWSCDNSLDSKAAGIDFSYG
jgi:hypothetical protein